MDPTISQVNQSFRVHHGLELNLAPEEPRNPAAAPDANPQPAAGQAQKPPRAAQPELDRLMRNLARETYSATAVDTLLGSKKGCSAALSQEDKNELQDLATSASDALEEINGLTVQNILSGKVVEGKGANKKEKSINAEALFTAAADRQFELGNKLRALAEDPRYAKYREELDDLSIKCDSRVTEIMTLYMEVADLGAVEAKDAAKGENEKKDLGDNTKLHEARVDNLLKGMAGSMHGNDKVQRFKDEVKSIEKRLAKFSKGAAVKTADLKQLLAEAKGLSAQLKAPDVVQTMDADIHAALTSHLDTLRDKLNEYVDKAVAATRKSFTASVPKAPATEKPVYVQKRGDVVKRIVAELDARLRSWNEQDGKVWKKADRVNKMGKLSGSDVVNAFRRDSGLSMPLAARIHGASEDEIDPQLCDKNLVGKPEKIGSGVANTVYKMTYRMADGSLKDYVFKPDLDGRVGLDKVMPTGYSYSDTQQAVKLNTATCEVAEFLGLGGLTGKNYVTVHEGQYGLLMEMAPGTEVAEIETDLDKSDLLLVGKLAKELNDLRWLDIATGQADRHNKNYLVDFGEDGETPKVTAIDNDVSFVPYLVGVGKFKIDYSEKRLAAFKVWLSQYCEKTGGNYAAILGRIQKNGYVIDVAKAGKEEICALSMTLQFHGFLQPQQMSARLCNRLSNLTDKELDELAKRLARKVDSKKSVDATIQRLKDLRRIAREYAGQEGKVIADGKWGVKSVLKKEMNCPMLDYRPRDEGDSRFDVDSVIRTQMTSILGRDFDRGLPDWMRRTA